MQITSACLHGILFSLVFHYVTRVTQCLRSIPQMKFSLLSELGQISPVIKRKVFFRKNSESWLLQCKSISVLNCQCFALIQPTEKATFCNEIRFSSDKPLFPPFFFKNTSWHFSWSSKQSHTWKSKRSRWNFIKTKKLKDFTIRWLRMKIKSSSVKDVISSNVYFVSLGPRRFGVSGEFFIKGYDSLTLR